MQVEVKQTGTINNKLALVKMIKDYTKWGLKESKDWVDSLSIGKIQYIDVSNPVNFEHELNQIGGVKCDSKSRIRQKKLLDIGIGELSDKIEFFSEELSDDLVRNYGSTYSDSLRFFKDFLSKMDEKDIDNLRVKYNDN
jgi:hypothetical protein